MASTMATTMGAPALDDGMEPWLAAVGLEEWCDVFNDVGLDHIDDLGAPPCLTSSILLRRWQLCAKRHGYVCHVLCAEDVTEEDFPKGLANMKYFDKSR